MTKISIIGSGNVATALGIALKKQGHSIVEIAGRNPAAVNKLAKKLHAVPVLLLKTFHFSGDLVIIAVNDDEIAAVTKVIKPGNAIVAHTSGSVSINVLSKKFKNCGVIYPLDTFSGKPKSLTTVPVCLEGSGKHTLNLLNKIAGSISKHIYIINSEQRKYVHLAAVIVNNFTNHLHAKSFELLKEHKISAALLDQLIQSTFKNILTLGPEASQTGPAVRNDKKTIDLHLKMLRSDKSLQQIYKLISRDIGQEK